MTQEELEYINKEFRCTWHPKYHRYSEEWLDNATDLQKSFIRSWSRGFMSPATDPNGIDIRI